MNITISASVNRTNRSPYVPTVSGTARVGQPARVPAEQLLKVLDN
ncbi:hypothetical protein [Falsirhodobacter sp. 1013]